MTDLPCTVLAATVWTYWFCVGAMSVRLRRRTRRLTGIVPDQGIEQAMWLVWVPLVAAWMTLPLLAAAAQTAPFGLMPWASQPAAMAARWLAAVIGVVCLGLSIRAWRGMGRNWRMSIVSGDRSELVTSGLFAHVRHPIYALSIALMLCTTVVVPTPAVALMAAIHIVLMVVKAQREERFLVERHGAAYWQYMERTGRFLPRLRGREGAAGTPR